MRFTNVLFVVSGILDFIKEENRKQALRNGGFNYVGT